MAMTSAVAAHAGRLI